MPVAKPVDGTQDPRSFFASEVERLRKAAKLSREQLGESLIVSADYIAKLERGVRPPTPETAARLDAVFKTDGHFARLCVLAEKSGTTPGFFKFVAEMEQTAVKIEEYAPSLVPGLLQTEQYARETFNSVWPYHPEERIEEMVQERMDRARLLDRPAGPELWVILGEAVLHDVLPEGIMASQLAHIEALIAARRIVVQILPSDVGMHALRAGNLLIMTLDDGSQVAYTDGPHTGRVMDSPKEVTDCRRSYDLVRAAALSPLASRARIKSALEEYKQHDD